MPFHLQRILRRQHEEGLVEQVDLVGHGDGLLRHGLQQRRLRFRRGAVDLVGQHEVGEDRARLERELAPTLRILDQMFVPVMSAGIRSGVNWMRLNSSQRLGERSHQHGLAQPGHALEQGVATGDEADQHVAHDVRLADHDGGDLVLDPRNHGAELGNGHRRRGAVSVMVTMGFLES